MSEFRSLLLKLSNEIERGDLEKMKFCCDFDIGAKRLSEITEAYELFKELEKRNLLGPQNTDILIELLEKAGRLDLKTIVLRLQSPATSLGTSVPDGPGVVNNILKNRHLDEISEDLSRDWKPLGWKLGLSAHILENVDDENRRVKEKAMQMMLRWKKRNGNNATGQTLADALIIIGRKDLAEKLQRICQQDGININISGQRDENSRAESGGLHSLHSDLAQHLPTQESGR